MQPHHLNQANKVEVILLILTMQSTQHWNQKKHKCSSLVGARWSDKRVQTRYALCTNTRKTETVQRKTFHPVLHLTHTWTRHRWTKLICISLKNWTPKSTSPTQCQFTTKMGNTSIYYMFTSTVQRNAYMQMYGFTTNEMDSPHKLACNFHKPA